MKAIVIDGVAVLLSQLSTNTLMSLAEVFLIMAKTGESSVTTRINIQAVSSELGIRASELS